MTRDTGWFKSSYSDAANDTCVEVRLTADAVGVRDSKSPSTGELWIPTATWAGILSQVSISS